MSTSVADFRMRFPEFVDDTEYPTLRIQMFLDDAQLIHMGSNESRWNGKYDIAQAYLAAHLLTQGTKTEAGDSNAQAGAIISKTAGGVSVSRAISTSPKSAQDEAYFGTAYGQQFVIIRNMCFAPVMTA